MSPIRWVKGIRNEKGIAVMVGLLILGVLLILGTGFVSLLLTESRVGERHLRATQTFFLAESGIDQAIAQLRSPLFLAQVADQPANDREIAYTPIDPQGIQPGGFEVDIDPVPGRPNVYRIQATGSFPGQSPSLPGFQQRFLEAYAQVILLPPPPPGLFGDVGVNLNGNVRINSYDSRTGFQPTGRGQVASNGTTPESIRIHGQVNIQGNVFSGPGASPSAIIITGNTQISGQMGPAAQGVPLPPVGVSTGSQNLQLTGSQVLTLPGGVYTYNSVSIGGSAQLNFTGPAELYVGSLYLSGSSLTTAQSLPANLKIFVSGPGQVNLNGVSGFTGVIYAPESQVNLNGNVQIFGSVTGYRIQGNGSVEVWHDEALNSGGSAIRNQVQLLSWEEP